MNEFIATQYERFVLRHPRTVLCLLAIIFIGFALGSREFDLDASADALILENDKDLQSFRQTVMRYETREFLFIAAVPSDDLLSETTLTTIGALRDEIADMPEVLDAVSLLDVPLVMNVQGSIAQIVTNFRTLRSPDVNLERAREELTASPIYQDLVASSDGKVTALQVFLKPHPELPRLRDQRDKLLFKKAYEGLTPLEESDLASLRPDYEKAKAKAEATASKAIANIRSTMKRYQGDVRFYLGGLPMITDDMVTYIRNDLVNFGSGVFVFLIVMLSLIFREMRWVLLPLASCIYGVTVMLGLLGHIGWQVTVISSNFVSLMLIITMSMNIHLVVRYRELFRDYPDADQFRLVQLTTQHMVRPCLYTALTTIIAFSSLVVSDIKPVIDFGWMMTIGLVVVFSTSFLLFPSLLLLTDRKPLKRPEDDTYMFTASLGRLTERFGKQILILAAVIATIGAMGMNRLEVENSFISYFHQDTEIYQGLKLIDETLGGTTPLDILLKFPEDERPDDGSLVDDLSALFENVETESVKSDAWFTPEKLDRIKLVHDYLDELPAVGKVLSLASGIRVAEKINGGVEFTAFELNIMYKRVPAAIRAQLIDPYVSIRNDEARISVRIFDSMPDLRRKELLEQIDRDLRDKFGLEAHEYEITGLMVLYNNYLQSLFRSQIMTLGAVMIGIMVMLTILFRSPLVALVGIIPNILAATSILGFMGWMQIPLDVMTITIAAITVGIAVDDCIHYLYRYKKELPRIGDPVETMHYCHANIAKAAFYTTLTITVGFSILVVSNFIPTILFGMLTAIAMVVALLAALTLMPKLILLWRPFKSV